MSYFIHEIEIDREDFFDYLVLSKKEILIEKCEEIVNATHLILTEKDFERDLIVGRKLVYEVIKIDFNDYPLRGMKFWNCELRKCGNDESKEIILLHNQINEAPLNFEPL